MEEDRPPAVELDRDRDQPQDGAEDGEAQHRRHDVDEPFGRQRHAAIRTRDEGEDRRPVELLDPADRDRAAEDVHRNPDDLPFFLADATDRVDQAPLLEGQADRDLVDDPAVEDALELVEHAEALPWTPDRLEGLVGEETGDPETELGMALEGRRELLGPLIRAQNEHVPKVAPLPPEAFHHQSDDDACRDRHGRLDREEDEEEQAADIGQLEQEEDAERRDAHDRGRADDICRLPADRPARPGPVEALTGDDDHPAGGVEDQEPFGHGRDVAPPDRPVVTPSPGRQPEQDGERKDRVHGHEERAEAARVATDHRPVSPVAMGRAMVRVG